MALRGLWHYGDYGIMRIIGEIWRKMGKIWQIMTNTLKEINIFNKQIQKDP